MRHCLVGWWGVVLLCQCSAQPKIDNIDPDTPEHARWAVALAQGHEKFRLVFSDEFNKSGRRFGEGQDGKWTAINSYNEGTLDLEGYNAAGATTEDGSLKITASLDITVDPSKNTRFDLYRVGFCSFNVTSGETTS